MKKTFNLTHPKIKYPRMIEAVKHEIRKYIRRERRKELPDGVDFWDFDCRFGDTEAEAKVIHPAEIDQYINDAEKRGVTSFYVEILRKEGIRAASKKARGEVPVDIPKPKGFGET
ncbi:hypothetical protein EGM51_04090 [Verrucomicrobia bacterium S94]|nr:hypothetical protein EGM51_04090 [Verrucomicrobia bacterium S94]